ncbi:hypothetical protein TNCV_2664501 [Trichonephila clavipes]|nr:hypothetical protein TNCV_2664501 [Trichonephila clavipes]
MNWWPMFLLSSRKFDSWCHNSPAIKSGLCPLNLSWLTVLTLLWNFGMDEFLLMSHCRATRGQLTTDCVILRPTQVMMVTPELASPSIFYTANGRTLSLANFYGNKDLHTACP